MSTMITKYIKHHPSRGVPNSEKDELSTKSLHFYPSPKWWTNRVWNSWRSILAHVTLYTLIKKCTWTQKASHFPTSRTCLEWVYGRNPEEITPKVLLPWTSCDGKISLTKKVAVNSFCTKVQSRC